MRNLVAPAAFDYDRHRARIDRWLARVAASAPVDRRAELRRLLDRVEAQG
jgi:hypothetical protein